MRLLKYYWVSMCAAHNLAVATIRDRDKLVCCPGTWLDECGCGGMTNSDVIDGELAWHERSKERT